MNTTQTRKEELEKDIAELKLDETEKEREREDFFTYAEFLHSRRNQRPDEKIRLYDLFENQLSDINILTERLTHLFTVLTDIYTEYEEPMHDEKTEALIYTMSGVAEEISERMNAVMHIGLNNIVN